MRPNRISILILDPFRGGNSYVRTRDSVIHRSLATGLAFQGAMIRSFLGGFSFA